MVRLNDRALRVNDLRRLTLRLSPGQLSDTRPRPLNELQLGGVSLTTPESVSNQFVLCCAVEAGQGRVGRYVPSNKDGCRTCGGNFFVSECLVLLLLLCYFRRRRRRRRRRIHFWFWF